MNRVRIGWIGLPLWAIALTAAAIVAPMCFLGNASGHDFQPHVASWIEVAHQWREGILFPRWAAGANYNFGEPRFIFYPPLSGFLGAALGSVLPWKVVPGVYVWLCLVLAGAGMFQLGRPILSPRAAIAAAIFFAANPYHIALIYYRSAFAELLASAMFPFVFAGVLAVATGRWSRLSLLAFSLAAIWLTNAPAAVVTTYSVALLLAVACISRRSVKPMVLGAVSMLAGICLAALYVLPAWWEQRWIQITAAASKTFNPEHNFLFTRANDPEFIAFNWKISSIAIVLIVLTLALIAFNRKFRTDNAEVWRMMLALAIAAVVLMLPFSGFVWRHLPELRYLQFPWRWLLVLGFVFGLSTAGAKRRASWPYLAIAVIVAATVITVAGDTAWDSEDVPAMFQAVSFGQGYEGIEGFQPRGANVDELDGESPMVAEMDPESGDIFPPETAKIDLRRWSTEDRVFEVRSDEPVTLALRVLNYPAWEVRVDGRLVQTAAAPQTGQIVIDVDAGSHNVALHFRRTRDRTLGAALSVVTLLCLSIPLAVRRTRVFRASSG